MAVLCSSPRFTGKNRIRHWKRAYCLWIKTMSHAKLRCMPVIITNTTRWQGSLVGLNFGIYCIFVKLLHEKAAFNQKALQKAFAASIWRKVYFRSYLTLENMRCKLELFRIIECYIAIFPTISCFQLTYLRLWIWIAKRYQLYKLRIIVWADNSFCWSKIKISLLPCWTVNHWNNQFCFV